MGAGLDAATLHRDVVLGVPLVSLLLALRARRCGPAHVGHAAATPQGANHHRGDGQRRLPGLPLRWGRHQRGGGGGVPRGGKGHGATGGPGAGRGPDHLLRHHLLLPHPGHALKQPTHTRRTNHGGAQGPDPRPPSPLRPRSVGGGGQRGGSTGIDRPMADLKEARG